MSPWLISEVHHSFIKIDGYSVLRSDRTTRNSNKQIGGGVVVYYRDGFRVCQFFSYGCEDFEILWLSFILHPRVYVTALLYHPPDATNEVDLSIHFSSVPDYSFRSLSCSGIFLSGDFNYFDITLLSAFKQAFKAFTRGRTQLD